MSVCGVFHAGTAYEIFLVRDAIDCKQPPFDDATVAQEFEYVATKLGISIEELQGYLDAPNKSYKDYKSQDSIYAGGARIMKLLGLELGGKR